MSDLHIALGQELTAHDLLGRGAASIDSKFEEHPEVRIRLRSVMSNAFISLEDYAVGERPGAQRAKALMTWIIERATDGGEE